MGEREDEKDRLGDPLVEDIDREPALVVDLCCENVLGDLCCENVLGGLCCENVRVGDLCCENARVGDCVRGGDGDCNVRVGEVERGADLDCNVRLGEGERFVDLGCETVRVGDLDGENDLDGEADLLELSEPLGIYITLINLKLLF